MPKRGNYNNRPPKVPKNTEFEKKSGKSFRMCEGIVLKCLVKYRPLCQTIKQTFISFQITLALLFACALANPRYPREDTEITKNQEKEIGI